MNIFSDEYKTWLKTLREGDEVAYDNSYSYHRTKNWKITRISKITPAGQFRLACGSLIGKEGRVKGKQHYHIEPVTDAIRDEVERDRLLRLIRHTQWDKLPTDVLKHIETWILFEEGEKTECLSSTKPATESDSSTTNSLN